MERPKANIKFHFLQALRAIAAWLVVADHALIDVTHSELSNPTASLAWTLGSVGVYVFFVISGFVMVHISWDDFGRPGAAPTFLRRRIIRIVPLYWLATLGAVVFHKVSANDSVPAGWPELLQSLLFIPYHEENIGWAPILRQGWTLNYEMMFYAIFALCLIFERKMALWGLAVALVIFTLVGRFFPPGILAYLSSPILLWFVLGVGIAALWRLGGFAEPKGLAGLAKFFEPFGDASYSIYLVHGIALTMLMRISGAPSVWFVPAGLLIATISGMGVHILIEKPMLQAAARLWSEPNYRARRLKC
jgi:exopolysaccharide production protein ExoZ